MALGDADVTEGSVGPVVGEHEGADAGGVGTEGDGHEVVHEPDMIAVALGYAGGFLVVGHLVAEVFVACDALFDLAYGGHVFVEFGAIGGGGVLVDASGVFEYEVEHAAVECAAFGILYGIAGAEEAFEDGAGVAFGRHGGGGTAPGEVKLVGAGVAGVAFA